MAFLTEFLVDGDMSLQLPILLKWTTDFSFRRSSVGYVRPRVPAHGENARQLLSVMWVSCASWSESQDEIIIIITLDKAIYTVMLPSKKGEGTIDAGVCFAS